MRESPSPEPQCYQAPVAFVHSGALSDWASQPEQAAVLAATNMKQSRGQTGVRRDGALPGTRFVRS